MPFHTKKLYHNNILHHICDQSKSRCDPFLNLIQRKLKEQQLVILVTALIACLYSIRGGCGSGVDPASCSAKVTGSIPLVCMKDIYVCTSS